MDPLAIMRAGVLVLVATTGTAVVATREPFSQTIGISFYGLVLTVMFVLFQAPDVALSQAVVGAVALPLMVMLALASLRRADLRRRARETRDRRGS